MTFFLDFHAAKKQPFLHVIYPQYGCFSGRAVTIIGDKNNAQVSKDRYKKHG